MSALEISWYLLIGVMLVVYSILDGFDLGVGIWYPFAKDERTRGAMFNAIGPFWDGNEVWLLGAGACLFAAFPPAYATIFSGFYLALMLVLFALIVRAVSIEFRSHAETPIARRGWGMGFALGSLLPALLFGVALGNLLRGIPLNAHGDFLGSFFSLLNVYALFIGAVSLVMLAAHGALYFTMKTADELAERGRAWARAALAAYLPLAVTAIIVSAATQPHLLANYLRLPLLWALPALTIAAILFAIAANRAGRDTAAFLASSASIALLLLTAVAGLFPHL
ncbi:MAG TPA: cytochrome d ubiquinol oxidase subunit II, partial [Armatimonadota bacterium]|nr:cytochrome d ubiquinol oxidase subunit II [Armatimonadota bacterium]